MKWFLLSHLVPMSTGAGLGLTLPASRFHSSTSLGGCLLHSGEQVSHGSFKIIVEANRRAYMFDVL